MDTKEERKKQLELSNAYLGGEKIGGVKYRHNSVVSYVDLDGNEVEGWIVSVGPLEPMPIYTVERSDGQGDEEIPEANLKLVLDPHEE